MHKIARTLFFLVCTPMLLLGLCLSPLAGGALAAGQEVLMQKTYPMPPLSGPEAVDGLTPVFEVLSLDELGAAL